MSFSLTLDLLTKLLFSNFSPSGVVLQSLEQICRYLLSDNTCKCGLECPIQLEKSFSFDPEIGSQPWSASCGSENLENLCNHRREILALSAFHTSQTEAAINSAGLFYCFTQKIYSECMLCIFYCSFCLYVLLFLLLWLLC